MRSPSLLHNDLIAVAKNPGVADIGLQPLSCLDHRGFSGRIEDKKPDCHAERPHPAHPATEGKKSGTAQFLTLSRGDWQASLPVLANVAPPVPRAGGRPRPPGRRSAPPRPDLAGLDLRRGTDRLAAVEHGSRQAGPASHRASRARSRDRTHSEDMRSEHRHVRSITPTCSTPHRPPAHCGATLSTQ